MSNKVKVDDLPKTLAFFDEILSPLDAPDNPVWSTFKLPAVLVGLGSYPDVNIRQIRPSFLTKDLIQIQPIIPEVVTSSDYRIESYRKNTGWARVKFEVMNVTDELKMQILAPTFLHRRRFGGGNYHRQCSEYNKGLVEGESIAQTLEEVEGYWLPSPIERSFKNAVNMTEERRLKRVRQTIFESVFGLVEAIGDSELDDHFRGFEERAKTVFSETYDVLIRNLFKTVCGTSTYPEDANLTMFSSEAHELMNSLRETLSKTKRYMESIMESRITDGDLSHLPRQTKKKLRVTFANQVYKTVIKDNLPPVGENGVLFEHINRVKIGEEGT